MLVFHPEVATRSCSDCQKYLYLPDGKRSQIQLDVGKFKDHERPKNIPTPCHKCPKISPERAPEFELLPKNVAAWNYYWRARAPLGHLLLADDVTHRNMEIIDAIVRKAERSRDLSGMAMSVAGAFFTVADKMSAEKALRR